MALEEYDFVIEYIRGADNAAADALSRLCISSDELKEMNEQMVNVMTRAQKRLENNNVTKNDEVTVIDDKEVIIANVTNEIIVVPPQNVDDIAMTLVSLLKSDKNEKRLEELREKLDKINNYVVNKENYAAILKNLTAESDLNATSFYKSLQEDDYMKFVKEKEPKNLYLKLKEGMNRNDIIKIIADKGSKRKIVKYARRMMQEDMVYNEKSDKEIINAVVDKFLGEAPIDNHTFEHRANDSIYWDPQGELEDLHKNHRRSIDGRRLFKGERTSIRSYPFMVSVHVVGRFWCGGAIYWHDLVLTSASCLQLMHNNRFFRENPKALAVRVGSNHSRIGGEEVEAIEVYFHPGYNPRTLRNNIAIIRLRRHLYFSYHRIPKLIEISKYPHGMASTAQVMLLGWGVTKMSQKLSYEPIYLQRKYLPIYPNTFCKEVYGDKFVASKMFCAGTMTTGEGACDHDAGGPAILGGKLVGIISFGPTVCGFPNAPTVFTLVGAYADWIKNVNESMPPYYRGKKYTTTTTRHMVFSYLETLLYLHTSTTLPPPSPSPLMELLRQGRSEEIFDDDESGPRQRIPPPVFKLTKRKPKRSERKKQKKEKKIDLGKQDLEIQIS
ncbi:transmembrane protease serine 11A-like [Amyelois transitella]|uniref:transmembrane protease serine 11A-like n=1 Tax=Amyelois transitella TaxID=680683 RepID=UPI00298F5578|nr:transmembrane protease serine 11A-like [Amyelois transitella]